eukprot:2407361-Pyramimonas_sp.AAC.1
MPRRLIKSDVQDRVERRRGMSSRMSRRIAAPIPRQVQHLTMALAIVVFQQACVQHVRRSCRVVHGVSYVGEVGWSGANCGSDPRAQNR